MRNCENVSYCGKKGLSVHSKFEYNNCKFSTRGKGEIFAQRIYITSGLNSLALLLSGGDRAKGILGWKLVHGLSVP